MAHQNTMKGNTVGRYCQIRQELISYCKIQHDDVEAKDEQLPRPVVRDWVQKEPDRLSQVRPNGPVNAEQELQTPYGLVQLELLVHEAVEMKISFGVNQKACREFYASRLTCVVV